MDNKRIQFVGGGTQKGGTSTLDVYLKKHPEIGMPEGKELHFFDHPKKFSSMHVVKDVALKNYHNRFLWEKAIQGEVTPTYMYFPECAPRIKSYNPDMKWILLLRNPIDRAYSQFGMLVSRGQEKRGFSDVIRNEINYRRNAPIIHLGKSFIPVQSYTYLDRGRYSQQLRRIFSFFPEEQVLIIESKSFYSEPEKELKRITDFLGVQPFATIENQKVNKTKYKIPMLDSDRDYLKEYYFHEIAELEQLTNMNFQHWLI
jgi:hypothetical protein